jgi:hypothetical protein
MYPDSFAEVLPSHYRDLFCKIQELTTIDLDHVVKVLQGLDVRVYRPNFDSVDKYLDQHGNLIKPPISTRDWAMTLGDTLYITPQYVNNFTSIDWTIQQFMRFGQKVRVLDRSWEAMPWIIFPSTVRVGKDILVDIKDQHVLEKALPALEEFAKTYRVHVSRSGDHSDGVFCPVKPGWIYSTHYRKQYDLTFPGWQVHRLTDTTKQRRTNGHNGQWWLPGFDYCHFNDKVFQLADTWIGDSRETVFEVNMLVVDEHNILVIAEDDCACRHLESLGFNVHVIDFRTRGFWDGGLHCITTDLHREGPMIDYWPGRGQPGIYYETT